MLILVFIIAFITISAIYKEHDGIWVFAFAGIVTWIASLLGDALNARDATVEVQDENVEVTSSSPKQARVIRNQLLDQEPSAGGYQRESPTEVIHNGTLVWHGVPRQVSFSYQDAKGNVTLRTISLTHIYKTQDGHYLEGYCHLRNEERRFKTSRIQGAIYCENVGRKFGPFLAFLSAPLKETKPAEPAPDQWQGGPVPVRFDYLDHTGKLTEFQLNLINIFRSHGQPYLHGNNLRTGREQKFNAERVQGAIYCNDKGYNLGALLRYLNQQPHHIAQSGAKEVMSYHDTLGARARLLAKLGSVDWRKEGILKMSGYQVGKTNDVKKDRRWSILNSLMLKDTLTDVRDKSYAAEWGKPGTKKRYKKIHDSLATFLNNGRARNRSGSINLNVAIAEWEMDLAYIERSFARRYG